MPPKTRSGRGGSPPAPSAGPSTGPLPAILATNLSLICQVVDDEHRPVGSIFTFKVLPMDLVDELAKMLVNAMKVKLKDLSLSDITEDALRLWKLHSPWPIESGDRDIPNIDELLESFSGDEASMAEKLHPLEFLSSYFNQSPPARHLHVIVEAAISSRMPHVREVDLEQVNRYALVFMRARQRDFFTERDVGENRIAAASGDPSFVTDFINMLFRRRRVDQNCLPIAQLAESGENFDQYFDSSTSTDNRPTADRAEVSHVVYLMNLDVQMNELLHGTPQNCFKENYVCWLYFFYIVNYFKSQANKIAVYRGTQWPFPLVVKVLNTSCTYTPMSDFLVTKDLLPRLLIEVNSTSQDKPPQDRHRMLVQGASVVRFANHFIDAYSVDKKFTLVAIYMRADGVADRYLLFQSYLPSSTLTDEVYFKKQSFDLNRWLDRLQFALELYNLGSVLKLDGADDRTSEAVGKLKTTVHDYKESYGLKTFRGGKTTKGKRKRSDADEGDRSGAGRSSARYGGSATQQLKAHGYELVLDFFEDERGGVWKRLIQLPPHVCTVYRVTDPNRVELIAKQVDEHSNELAILQYLRTIRPQSPHIIPLIENISMHDGGWLILPKLLPLVELFLHASSAELHAKLLQYSCNLIKGLAYLHKHGVAHLDIKLDNLVYTDHGPLQIIDFDSAVRVQAEDEKIKGLCGTPGWRAPEIGDDEEEIGLPPVFSPIRADRWSCGRVLLELIGEVGGEGVYLVKFAKRLMAVDPCSRPSLLDWHGVEGGGNVRPQVKGRADGDCFVKGEMESKLQGRLKPHQAKVC